jgi:heat shock protein HslJ
MMRQAVRYAMMLLLGAAALVFAGAAMAEDDDVPLTASWVAFELEGKPVEGLTLQYTTDKVSGSGGCNRFTGPIAIEDDAVQIGPLASTRMMCEGKTKIEGKYFAALEAARTFALDGETLVLKGEDGDVLVKYRK